MRRLVLLFACLAASAATACLAAEPASCKSMCASEQRQCQGGAKQERLLPVAKAQYGSAFSGAQDGRLRGSNVKELDNSTRTFNRLAHNDACEAAAQQCTLDCDKQEADAAAKNNGQAKQAG